MGYEINIGGRPVTLHDYTSAVNAPNTAMNMMFKGMQSAVGDVRIAAMRAENESEAVQRIHSDPDLTDAAKSRRRKEAVDRETVKDFRNGLKAINTQAANILTYLKRELQPVKPLDSDDVQGFMRDSELRQVFRATGREERSHLINAMHRGEQSGLSTAILRGDPLCSGLTGDQYSRLVLSCTSTVNGPVIQAVHDLVTAARKDVEQIKIAFTWYSNLIYGLDDKPEQYVARLGNLDALTDYVNTMMKINQRQEENVKSDNDIEADAA